jgi:hypothetical protein
MGRCYLTFWGWARERLGRPAPVLLTVIQLGQKNPPQMTSRPQQTRADSAKLKVQSLGDLLIRVASLGKLEN